jgi:hypothetical protein
LGTSGFKKIFDSIANKSGWNVVRGGWVFASSVSDECIVSIDLQKSNHSKRFYVNMNIYVQGAFGRKFDRDLDVTNTASTAFRRSPKDFDDAFDLTSCLADDERNGRIVSFFSFLEHFAQMARTRCGLLNLAEDGEIHLIAGVREEVARLVKNKTRC